MPNRMSLSRQLFPWAAAALMAAVPVNPAHAQARPGDAATLDALEVEHLTVETLEVPPDRPAGFTVAVSIGGQPETLQLERSSMRAEGFRVRVQDRDGLHDVEPPPVGTYRGHLLGRAGTTVAATLTDEGMTATIVLENLSHWYVQPLGGPATGDGLHVTYHRDDVVGDDRACGSEDQTLPGGDDSVPLDPPGGGGGPLVAIVAFDADVEFYELNGSSVTNTVNDIEAVMNGVSAVYETELGISYAIGEIIVRTGEPDPYTTTEFFDLLVEFGNEWKDYHDDVVRDAAHLMTGKDLEGNIIGVAWQGVICSTSQNAFGLSQSRYTANFSKRVSLTAHELGHNWNAGHCAPDCSSGPADCAIMCPCNGGCDGGVTTFGEIATAQIGAYAAGAECLGSPPGDPCPCDIDDDGYVGVLDLVSVVGAWGDFGGAADVNDDGFVDVFDLEEVIFAWGACP